MIILLIIKLLSDPDTAIMAVSAHFILCSPLYNRLSALGAVINFFNKGDSENGKEDGNKSEAASKDG